MRATNLTALAALALAVGVSGPLATAEASPSPTHPVPESAADPHRLVFTDEPGVVDTHPLALESWSRTAGDAVTLNFTLGSPRCYGVHATAQETDDVVTVTAVGGTRPDAVGLMCTMEAVSGAVEVPLSAPVGDRQVLATDTD